MTTNYFKKIVAAGDSPNRGFTLIETIVALAILLIAVVAPVSLIGDALHKMYYARDEVLAVNLAQEGIEMVRQIRDSNVLSGAGWLTNLGGGAPSTYMVDAYNFINGAHTMIYCGGSCGPQPVYFDSNIGLYRQNSVSTPTQFSRIVTVVGVSATEAQVTSAVTWKTGGTAGSVSVSEDIFRWAI